MSNIHLEIGTLLRSGTYRVVRFINKGGFGCTYEVEHTVMHVRMAIKEFFVEKFCNRDQTGKITLGTESQRDLLNKLKRKFIQEARFLYNLKHDNIIRVTDVFEENGTAYYAMEYIDGLTLWELVKSQGPLDEHIAINYILKVCDALEYVHQHNMLHLDIKPDNIMVSRDSDRIILIDFGVAKQYDEENGQNTSTLLGHTPGYAPIEQCANGLRQFTPPTDIYALGATLYSLLSGIRPIESPQIASGETITDLPSYISQFTKNTIYRSMRLSIKERPQSINEFRQLITGVGAQAKTIIGDENKNNDSKTEVVTYVEKNSNNNTSKLKYFIIFGSAIAFSIICLIIFLTRSNKAIENTDDIGLAVENLQKNDAATDDLACLKIACDVHDAMVRCGDEDYRLDDFIKQGKKFEPGTYNLKVYKDGYAPSEMVVDLYSGHTTNLSINLQKSTKSDIPHTVQTQVKEQLQPSIEQNLNQTEGEHTGHQWVDLGLPSGIKWSTCNAGAKSKGQVGQYFAWGESAAKSNYIEDNSVMLGKSGFGSISGKSQYDAARAIWKGKWHLPSKSDYEELIQNCNATWTTINSVGGMLFTSKINGKSIFFPAAGYMYDIDKRHNGENGYYWCSEPNGTQNAWHLRFNNGRCYMAKNGRCLGMLVRPVLTND